MQENKCKIILLCGYLGSGKTTLIQHILKNQIGLKVAVIQNEFSDEMGIEAPTMQDSDGKPFNKFYELPNGCICCSAKTELMVAIDYLIQQEKYGLQFILIEINGLADPSLEFWVDDDLKYPAQLQSVQTLVASHKIESLLEEEIYQKQLLFSNQVVFNYQDKINQELLDDLKQKIRNINPLANFIDTTYSELNLQQFFKLDGFSERQQFNISEMKNAHQNKDIKQFFFSSENQFDLNKMNISIGTILWEQPHEILRAKGIINIKDNEYMHIIDDVFEIKQTEMKWQSDKRMSKFLFIGKNLQNEEIQNAIID